MKNLKYLLLAAAVVVVALLFITTKNNNSTEENTSDNEALGTISVDDKNSASYSEGDEIEGYNYIANPDALEDFAFTVNVVSELPDDVNELLQQNGVTDCALTATNIDTVPKVQTADLVSDDCDYIVKIEYDQIHDELNLYLEEK